MRFVISENHRNKKKGRKLVAGHRNQHSFWLKQTLKIEEPLKSHRVLLERTRRCGGSRSMAHGPACTESRGHRRCGLSYGPPAEHSSGRVPFIIDACLDGPALVHLAAISSMQIKPSQSSNTQRDHIMKNVISIDILFKSIYKNILSRKVPVFQSSPLIFSSIFPCTLKSN